jgi:hypothetical protein
MKPITTRIGSCRKEGIQIQSCSRWLMLMELVVLSSAPEITVERQKRIFISPISCSQIFYISLLLLRNYRCRKSHLHCAPNNLIFVAFVPFPA